MGRVPCRPEDFEVHEIDDNQQEAAITNASIPTVPVREESATETKPIEKKGSYVWR